MSVAPSPEETRANQTYAALLWALSRPGQIKELPCAGEVCIIECLIDRETRVHCAEPDLMSALLRTGAELVTLPQADHVFLGICERAEVLKDVAQGSDLYPDAGATLVIRAKLHQGRKLRLTGPGVDGSLTLTIDGLPDGFWTLRAQVMRYPMGFDIFLIDGARIVGLPRSCAVEVL